MSCEVFFDLNNLAHRVFFGMKEIKAQGPYPEYALWHYIMYTQINDFLSTVPGDLSKVILAVDDQRNWRKLIYPPYKADRAGKRAAQAERDVKAGKQPVDMEKFYAEYEKFIVYAQTYLPFHTLRQRFAEADDIIGILALRNSDTDPGCTSIIVSADEDYLQCFRSRKMGRGPVLIFDPLKRQYRECENTERFLEERFLMGQKKDNIFNCLTPSTWDKMSERKGSRKPAFGATAAEKALAGAHRLLCPTHDPKNRRELVSEFMDKKAAVKIKRDKETGKMVKPNFYRGWRHRVRRNRRLIDLRQIPQPLVDAVLAQDAAYAVPGPEMLEAYFAAYNWPSIIPQLQTIQQRYAGLYRS